MIAPIVRGTLVGVALVAALPSLAGEAPSDACPLAVVAGSPVPVSIADDLRAVLAPPPSREAARRLAVDAALVAWNEGGTLGTTSAKAWLDAWRRFLVSLDDDAGNDDPLGRRAARRLVEIAQRAHLYVPTCNAPDAAIPAQGP